VTLILESDCTLVFTVLLLLVEGLKVFVALRFDMVVVPVAVTRCRAAR